MQNETERKQIFRDKTNTRLKKNGQMKLQTLFKREGTAHSIKNNHVKQRSFCSQGIVALPLFRSSEILHVWVWYKNVCRFKNSGPLKVIQLQINLLGHMH
jgi:hypothetical protein